MPANRNQLPWNATVKAYPSVGDLQAVESFTRVKDTKNNVGAPSYRHDVYTIPAGKIFHLELLTATCAQADPTFVEFALRKGVSNYVYYNGPYGAAWSTHRWVFPLKYDESEIVCVIWTGTLAATDVMASCFGYLIDKY